MDRDKAEQVKQTKSNIRAQRELLYQSEATMQERALCGLLKEEIGKDQAKRVRQTKTNKHAQKKRLMHANEAKGVQEKDTLRHVQRRESIGKDQAEQVRLTKTKKRAQNR